MSSTWDINWDLNSSSRTTQQLYAGTTPFSANGVVEASDDSQNMTDLVAVNGHRNAWSSTSGLDLQLVDTWAVCSIPHHEFFIQLIISFNEY